MNPTCAISNLPIEREDLVRLVILFQDDTPRGTRWAPVQVPIQGTCTGGVEVKTVENEWAARMLVINLRGNVVCPSPSMSKDLRSDLEDENPYVGLKTLMSILGRGIPVQASVRGKKTVLSTCLVREDIYSALAATTTWSLLDGEVQERDAIKAEEREITTIVATQKVRLKTAQTLRDEMMAAGLDPSTQATLDRVSTVLELSNRITDQLQEDTASDWAWFSTRNVLTDLLTDGLDAGSEAFNGLLDELVDYRTVSRQMEHLGRSWHPSRFAEDEAWELHAQFAMAILRVCEAKQTQG